MCGAAGSHSQVSSLTVWLTLSHSRYSTPTLIISPSHCLSLTISLPAPCALPHSLYAPSLTNAQSLIAPSMRSAPPILTRASVDRDRIAPPTPNLCVSVRFNSDTFPVYHPPVLPLCLCLACAAPCTPLLPAALPLPLPSHLPLVILS